MIQGFGDIYDLQSNRGLGAEMSPESRYHFSPDFFLKKIPFNNCLTFKQGKIEKSS